jgi:uncharacterized protein YukE
MLKQKLVLIIMSAVLFTACTKDTVLIEAPNYEDRLEQIEQRLSLLESIVSLQNNEILTLQELFQDWSESLDLTLYNINQAISSLQSQVNSMDVDINLLDQAVTDLRNDLANLVEQLDQEGVTVVGNCNGQTVFEINGKFYKVNANVVTLGNGNSQVVNSVNVSIVEVTCNL